MKQEKRIPTILGILILIAATIAGVYLTSSGRIFSSRASSECLPSNIQFTNISHLSANVSFFTPSACLVSLKINNTVINDFRPSITDKSKLHYFQISNLKEDTLYHFEVLADGKTYNAASYQFKTAQEPSSPVPTSNLAWGKVFTSQKQPANGSVVFLNIPGAAPLSAPVTSSGNWNISFATSFNQSLNNWFTPEVNTDEEIIVLAETEDPTIISANTNLNNPVPDIILGQNFFSQSSPNVGQAGNFPQSTPNQLIKKLEITYPKEAETISSLKPEFLGTGPQNKSISINLTNFSQTWDVVADSQGNFRWTPPQGILPGQNTITMAVGLESITRNFIVDSSGGLAFEASQSAEPTIDPTPTIAPLTTPTPAPIAEPTLVPTLAPSPTMRAAHPSTESGIPQSGTGPLTVFIVLSSVLITFISLQFIKKSSNF